MLLPGMRFTRPASVTAYSAKPPGAEPMTRSPALKSLTSLPTASTSPEHSKPIRAPTPPTGPCWMPAATNVSARLRLEARTLISTSLGFGSGFGRSRTSIPFSPRTAAFTIIPPVGRDVLSFRGRYYKARRINNEPARPAKNRRFGLPARLSVDLRARGRDHRRAHHRPGPRRRGECLHRRRDLRQGRALRRTRASPRSLEASTAPRRTEGLRRVCTDFLGRRARSGRRAIPPRRTEARLRSGVAVLLRWHHGFRAARRHQPAAPR